MSLREAVRIALRALRANRLRSALTMLGIIIGVAAVVLLVAIGNGVQSSVNERVEPLANLLTIVPTVGNVPGGTPPQDLIDADVSALQDPDRAPDVASVTPAITGAALAESDASNSRTSIIGSTDRWLEVNNRELRNGAFFDEAQVRSAARVVVLGPAAVNNLFDGDPAAALGQTVRINRQQFSVIGVMDAVGEPGDNIAVMPLDTARRYIFGGGNVINQIIVRATQASAVPAAEHQVIDILSDRHRINDPAERDFEVQSLRAQLTTFNQILDILTLFTAAVAAISLVVGAIGVLNIMLVSVTERTREIGIRKAIGATRRAILQQFLIESTEAYAELLDNMINTGVPAGQRGGRGARPRVLHKPHHSRRPRGVVGVLIGIGLSVLGAAIAPSFGPTFATFAPAVSIPSIVVSFAISLAIGLIADGYPANRAARLRPVEALRYE
jgi:putative ABC transport system permease protein